MTATQRVDSLLDAVGETPLVRLESASPQGGATVWGKAEHLNPGGSLKDRIGVALLEAAEEEIAVAAASVLAKAAVERWIDRYEEETGRPVRSLSMDEARENPDADAFAKTSYIAE